MKKIIYGNEYDDESEDEFAEEFKGEGKTRQSKKGAMEEICKYIFNLAKNEGITPKDLKKSLKNPMVYKNQSYSSPGTIKRRIAYIRKNYPDEYVKFDFKTGKYKVVKK